MEELVAVPPIVLSWLWVQRGTVSGNSVMVCRAIRAGFTFTLCTGTRLGCPQVDRVDPRKWQRVERAGAVVAP